MMLVSDAPAVMVKKEIIAGIVALALLVGTVYVMSGRHKVSGATADDGMLRLQAAFEQVDGIRVGTAVMLSGVKVGHVESMVLDDDYQAVLGLAVGERLEITEDVVARVRTRGIFGRKFLSLSVGGSDNTLGDGDEISYTQGAILLDDILELIIQEGRKNRQQ